MAEQPMHHRPERYEDTEDPHHPPRSTGPAPVVIAGLWYVLAPVAILLLLLFVLLLYWAGNGLTERDAVEPTTGIRQGEEATPGGFQPDPRYETPEEEREFRGGR